MSDCLLCGCDDTVHTPRLLNPARPCEAVKQYTELTNGGEIVARHSEQCGCPGLELEDEEGSE